VYTSYSLSVRCQAAPSEPSSVNDRSGATPTGQVSSGGRSGPLPPRLTSASLTSVTGCFWPAPVMSPRQASSEADHCNRPVLADCSSNLAAVGLQLSVQDLKRQITKSLCSSRHMRRHLDAIRHLLQALDLNRLAFLPRHHGFEFPESALVCQPSALHPVAATLIRYRPKSDKQPGGVGPALGLQGSGSTPPSRCPPARCNAP